MNESKAMNSETKRTEDGKTELGYDYEHAIGEATRLWNELKQNHAARGWKYPPVETAFDHLLSAWKAHPGRAIVHLNDLPDLVHVKFDDAALSTLRDTWSNLVRNHTFRRAYQENRSVYQTIRGKYLATSVGALRLLEPGITSTLEKHVVSVRAGANGKEVSVRFPFRIDNEAFAKLFGYYGDLIQKKVLYTSKSKEAQTDFIATVRSALGPIGVALSNNGPYFRTYSTTFIQHILAIGGLNTSIRQLEADNPAPLFLFAAPRSVVKEYLRSLFESEGGTSFVSKRGMPGSVDLHQAVLRNIGEQTEHVPRHPKRLSFRQLRSQAKLLAAPSRLLLSASLLLLRFSIRSRLWPADLYRNDLNETVMRWRLMITGSDISKFKQHIGFISSHKQQRLKSSPPPFSFSRRAVITRS